MSAADERFDKAVTTARETAQDAANASMAATAARRDLDLAAREWLAAQDLRGFWADRGTSHPSPDPVSLVERVRAWQQQQQVIAASVAAAKAERERREAQALVDADAKYKSDLAAARRLVA